MSSKQSKAYFKKMLYVVDYSLWLVYVVVLIHTESFWVRLFGVTLGSLQYKMNKGVRLMKTVRALELMQDSFDSMMRSGLLENEVEVSPETVLLGVGSSLDSLGFITFLSAGALAQYIEKITG
jgi:hypothetical protein